MPAVPLPAPTIYDPYKLCEACSRLIHTKTGFSCARQDCPLVTRRAA